MVYSCQVCGTWFRKDQLFKDGVLARVVECKACGVANEIERIKKESPVTKGYGYLARGDFGQAVREFNRALEDADLYTETQRTRLLDGYIGRALAEYNVQTIYTEKDDDVADKLQPPRLTCCEYNRSYFSDSFDYRKARSIIRTIQDPRERNLEMDRIEALQKFIDGVKNEYDALAEEDIRYQLFIAYEDDSKDSLFGWKNAQELKKCLPDKVNRVFIPEMEDRTKNPAQYEANILYAVEHSQAMLAIIDDDPDNRLIDLYSRYELVHRGPNGYSPRLGFVCFDSAKEIHTRSHHISENVFVCEDTCGINRFVCLLNGIVVMNEDPDDRRRRPVPISAPITTASVSLAPVMEGDSRVVFGCYPQRVEKNKAIENHFKCFGRPCAEDDHGWTPLFFHKKDGKPYTWYRDETIQDKKYRGIYYSQYRDITAVRDTDVSPSIQRIRGYLKDQFHVFRFEPIYWNIIERIEKPYKRYTLIPSMSLDSHPFNDCEECGLWDVSTLRAWLNSVFLNTAFSEQEQKYLNMLEDEKVFLVDEKRDLNNPQIRTSIVNFNLGGTDYFRCMGGKVEKNISWFWIQAENCFEDKAKVLSLCNRGSIAEMNCDTTTVAVVPKIYVNVK